MSLIHENGIKEIPSRNGFFLSISNERVFQIREFIITEEIRNNRQKNKKKKEEREKWMKKKDWMKKFFFNGFLSIFRNRNKLISLKVLSLLFLELLLHRLL